MPCAVLTKRPKTMHAISDRIEWLRVRSRLARTKANELLAEELEQTATTMEQMKLAIKRAIDSGETGFLVEAVEAINEGEGK